MSCSDTILHVTLELFTCHTCLSPALDAVPLSNTHWLSFVELLCSMARSRLYVIRIDDYVYSISSTWHRGRFCHRHCIVTRRYAGHVFRSDCWNTSPCGEILPPPWAKLDTTCIHSPAYPVDAAGPPSLFITVSHAGAECDAVMAVARWCRSWRVETRLGLRSRQPPTGRRRGPTPCWLCPSSSDRESPASTSRFLVSPLTRCEARLK